MAYKLFQDWLRRESPPPPPRKDEDKLRQLLTWISSLLAQVQRPPEKQPTQAPRQIGMRPATGAERPADLPPYQPDITGEFPSDVYGWLAKMPTYAAPYETNVAQPFTEATYGELAKTAGWQKEPAIELPWGSLSGEGKAKLGIKGIAHELAYLPFWVMPGGGEAKGAKAIEQATKFAESQLTKGTAIEDIVRGLSHLKIPEVEAKKIIEKLLGKAAKNISEAAPKAAKFAESYGAGIMPGERVTPELSASFRAIVEMEAAKGTTTDAIMRMRPSRMPEDVAREIIDQVKTGFGKAGYVERRGMPRIPGVAPKAPVAPSGEAQAGLRAEQVAEGAGGMKPPPKPPPTAVAPTPPEQPANAVEKAKQILPTVKKLTKEYADKLHKIRSQRLGAAVGAKEAAGGGEKGLYAELGQLKGKVEKPTFTPTYDNYTQAERDELFNLIDSFEFTDGLGEALPQQGYTRIAVKTAFRDILDGVKPTPQNFKYLEQVFGKEAMKPLLKFMSPRWGDYLTELFYNSILSNPKTHIVNFASNTLTAVMSPFEKGIAATIEVPLAAIQRRPRQRFFGEVAQEIFGVMRGIPEGARAAFKMLKNGQTIEQLSKWEQRTSAFKGKAATIIKLPTRFLEAADVFGRGINRMMALRAQAYRVASKEGLKGEKFLARLNELMMNPTEEMLEEASRIAEYRLFRQEPGKFVSRLMKLRDAEIWGIQPLRFVIPFLRTPANLVKFGLERSPLAVFNVPMWKSVAAKSPEAAEQIARWVMGSTIAAAISIYVADGKITGAAPKDALKRDAFYRAGKQPYSIKIGDIWISYQRLEPFNQVIAQVAAVVEAIRSGEAKTDIFNTAQQVVSTIMNNLVSQTYMSGIANLIGAAEDPVGEGQYLIQQLTTGLVPYSGLMRGLSQAVEPTYRQPGNIPEAVMTEIPGLAEKVKPRTNLFGEISERTTPWYSPFNISPEKQTPLDKELERLGIVIGYPSSIIGTTKLDEQQIYEYRNFVGQALMRELSAAIESPAYKAIGSDVAKSDYIDRIIRDTRADAREQFAEMIGISTQTEKQQRTPAAAPSMVPEREKAPLPSNVYVPGYVPRTTAPAVPGSAKRKLPTLE
jgi:hypothetical protein